MKYIFIIFLTGCTVENHVDLQLEPVICTTDGFAYSLAGLPLIDINTGEQMRCEETE